MKSGINIGRQPSRSSFSFRLVEDLRSKASNLQVVAIGRRTKAGAYAAMLYSASSVAILAGHVMPLRSETSSKDLGSLTAPHDMYPIHLIVKYCAIGNDAAFPRRHSDACVRVFLCCTPIFAVNLPPQTPCRVSLHPIRKNVQSHNILFLFLTLFFPHSQSVT